MSVDMRLIRQNEYAAAHRLWDICFPEDVSGFSDYYFSCRTNYANILGAFDDKGTLIADLHMLSYDLDFFGVQKHCCMVAGVATLPEYRKRGISTALLYAADDVMRKRGYYAALLQPFDAAFYARAGYYPFTLCEKFSVSRKNFTLISPAVLHIPTADELLSIYNEYASHFVGMMKRDICYMNELFVETKTYSGQILASKNAYAIFTLEEDRAIVSELVSKDPLGLISMLCEKYNRVEFFAPQGLIKLDNAGVPYVFNMIKPLTNTLFDSLPVHDTKELLSRKGFALSALEYY